MSYDSSTLIFGKAVQLFHRSGYIISICCHNIVLPRMHTKCDTMYYHIICGLESMYKKYCTKKLMVWWPSLSNVDPKFIYYTYNEQLYICNQIIVSVWHIMIMKYDFDTIVV